jgi:beta-mannanase
LTWSLPRVATTVVIALLLWGATLTAPGAQARAAAVVPVPPSTAVLFGLDDHWESDIVADDTQDAAKSGVVGTFLNWGTTKASSIVNYAKWANTRQAVPMIDLYPPTTVTLASIAAGSQDAALTADAKALHTWNHVFLFRLFPEMNGSWESYAPGTNGNTSAQFVAAWRHIYNLFHQVGATKVIFVWNPDKEPSEQFAPLSALWPGSGYVNWVGIDVFDREDTAHGTFPNPVTAIQKTVTDIKAFSTKPLMLAETGTVTSPVKATWIKQLFTGTNALGVKAVVYFNEFRSPSVGGVNWRLDSSAASLAATKATLAGTGVAWPGHNNGSLTNDEFLLTHGVW